MLQVDDQAKFCRTKIRTTFLTSFGSGSFPRILIHITEQTAAAKMQSNALLM